MLSFTETMEQFPGSNIGVAVEMNYIFERFNELPKKERKRLAKAILLHSPTSEPFVEAGAEVFQALLDADSAELARYVENTLGTEQIFTGYMIMPDDIPGKAYMSTHLLRSNLNEENKYRMELIEIPNRNKKTAQV